MKKKTSHDDKTVSIEDLEKQLDTSSEGLILEDAQARLQHYGYNELAEKKKRSILKFLSYFWGPTHSLDDRSGRPAVRRDPTLTGFFHYCCPAAGQCSDRLLGGIPGRQCYCCA